MPEQLAGGRIPIHKPSTVVNEKNWVQGVLEDSMKAPAVFLKLLLHALALGDVASQANDSGQSAVRIHERSIAPFADDRAAILGAVLVHAVGVHVTRPKSP